MQFIFSYGFVSCSLVDVSRNFHRKFKVARNGVEWEDGRDVFQRSISFSVLVNTETLEESKSSSFPHTIYWKFSSESIHGDGNWSESPARYISLSFVPHAFGMRVKVKWLIFSPLKRVTFSLGPCGADLANQCVLVVLLFRHFPFCFTMCISFVYFFFFKSVRKILGVLKWNVVANWLWALSFPIVQINLDLAFEWPHCAGCGRPITMQSHVKTLCFTIYVRKYQSNGLYQIK